MSALALAITASSAGLGAYLGARARQRPTEPRAPTPARDDDPDGDLAAVAFDWAEQRGRPDVAVLVASKLTTLRRVNRRRQNRHAR